MGLVEKINEKAMSGAGKIIKKKIESTIKKVIKEDRLVFLDDDRVSYVSKDGRTQNLSLDEMAFILVNAAGQENLLNVGITPDDVRNMLVEARDVK